MQTNNFVGDGAAIFATFPIWTVLLAAVLLKERIRWFHVVAMLLGLNGLMFITKPSFAFGQRPDDKGKVENYPAGATMCLVASVSNAFAFLALRKLKHIKATYSGGNSSLVSNQIESCLALQCTRMVLA